MGTVDTKRDTSAAADAFQRAAWDRLWRLLLRPLPESDPLPSATDSARAGETPHAGRVPPSPDRKALPETKQAE